ncbi:MAG: hypothetical protein CBB65_13295 [Hyphomonadaceae bacterium TMED5]|nr:hypothetical protein [Ponticaulis sp.]OUX97771.1 MAG: hypothetical protein CBB65_13295 [Hyphomonadaceae bacterium TMED5]
MFASHSHCARISREKSANRQTSERLLPLKLIVLHTHAGTVFWEIDSAQLIAPKYTDVGHPAYLLSQ